MRNPRINIQVTDDARAVLEALTEKHDRSQSWIISRLLEHCGNHPEVAEHIFTR